MLLESELLEELDFPDLKERSILGMLFEDLELLEDFLLFELLEELLLDELLLEELEVCLDVLYVCDVIIKINVRYVIINRFLRYIQ